MSNEVKISVVIIAYNEERKIGNCLQSLVGVADEIVVVDSFSTDNTKEVCARYNVHFIQHAFEGYVGQKNYALRAATHDHVLSLDADEWLSDDLQESIKFVKANWDSTCDGYAFNRFNNYYGKWLRYGGAYPDKKIRLWDRRKAQWGGVDPHDSVVMLKGAFVKKLKGDLMHHSYTHIDDHIRQLPYYSEVAARAKYLNGDRANFFINLVLSPLYRFFSSYFLRLGFLDGFYGFVFSTLSSYLTLLKYMRLYEYQNKGLPEKQLLTKPVKNI